MNMNCKQSDDLWRVEYNMSEAEYSKYLEAVDLVCINCVENTTNENVCENCPVRRSCDTYEREKTTK